MRIRVAVLLVMLPFTTSSQSATPPQTLQPQPVLRAGNGVTAPRLTYKPEPVYTEEAQRARLQGSVVLYFVVGADGALSDFRVERSLGMGLDENAIEAVKKWRFKPGEKDGKPVAVSGGAVVNYRLESAIGILKNSQMGWHLGNAVFGTPEGASRPVFLEANGEAPEGNLSVTVSLVINEQGNPVTIHVPRLGASLAEATHLEEAIMNFVRSWRFSPALKDDKPIAVSGAFDLLLSKP